jgi:hypothetical protein
VKGRGSGKEGEECGGRRREGVLKCAMSTNRKNMGINRIESARRAKRKATIGFA